MWPSCGTLLTLWGWNLQLILISFDLTTRCKTLKPKFLLVLCILLVFLKTLFHFSVSSVYFSIFLIIYWQQKASFHLKGYSIFNGYKVLILLYLFAVLVCCWCCFWRTVTTIFLFYFFFPFLFFLSLFLLQFFSYLYLLISVQNGEFSTLESWETMKQCETTNKMIKPEFKASGQLLSFFNGFFKAAWSKHGHVIILCAMKYSELTLNYTHIFRSQTKYDVSKHKELITIR